MAVVSSSGLYYFKFSNFVLLFLAQLCYRFFFAPPNPFFFSTFPQIPLIASVMPRYVSGLFSGHHTETRHSFVLVMIRRAHVFF